MTPPLPRCIAWFAPYLTAQFLAAGCQLILLERSVFAEVVIVSGDEISRQSYAKIKESIPTILESVPAHTIKATLRSDSGTVDARLCYTTRDMQMMLQRAGQLDADGLQQGRFLSIVTGETPEAELVLSSHVAEQLFLGESALGKRIVIDGGRFLVVGILSTRNAPEISGTAFSTFLKDMEITELWIHCHSDADNTRDAVRAILQEASPNQEFSIEIASSHYPKAGETSNLSTDFRARLIDAVISLTVALLFALSAMEVIPLSQRFKQYHRLFWWGAVASTILALCKVLGYM